jgi:hypothetical protein
VAANGYLTSCRTRRRRQQLFCVDLRGRDPFDADDDPAAGIRHLTNIILIASAIPAHNYPTLALHTVLLPLNTCRLHQMLQLVRDVKKSVNSDLSMEWLKPFMTERKCAPGEVLFYKEEKAEDMALGTGANAAAG